MKTTQLTIINIYKIAFFNYNKSIYRFYIAQIRLNIFKWIMLMKIFYGYWGQEPILIFLNFNYLRLLITRKPTPTPYCTSFWLLTNFVLFQKIIFLLTKNWIGKERINVSKFNDVERIQINQTLQYLWIYD